MCPKNFGSTYENLCLNRVLISNTQLGLNLGEMNIARAHKIYLEKS